MMLSEIGRRPSAATVRVAVRSSDPVAGAGATSMLVGDARLSVVDLDAYRVDVVLVVEDVVTESTLVALKDAAQKSTGRTAPSYVLVTDRLEPVHLVEAVSCGVRGVVARRDATPAALTHAVLAVGSGAGFLDPSLQGALLSQLDRLRQEVLAPNGMTLQGISARDRDILRGLADGDDTNVIAERLGCSERTVKTQLYALMAKHNLNTRAHAVAYAMRIGVA